MRLTVCFLILMIPIHGPITRYKMQVYPTQDETYCLFPDIDDSLQLETFFQGRILNSTLQS